MNFDQSSFFEKSFATPVSYRLLNGFALGKGSKRKDQKKDNPVAGEGSE
jgi:hypothetical protein